LTVRFHDEHVLVTFPEKLLTGFGLLHPELQISLVVLPAFRRHHPIQSMVPPSAGTGAVSSSGQGVATLARTRRQCEWLAQLRYCRTTPPIKRL
jgi:hypothetical protein